MAGFFCLIFHLYFLILNIFQDFSVTYSLIKILVTYSNIHHNSECIDIFNSLTCHLLNLKLVRVGLFEIIVIQNL